MTRKARNAPLAALVTGVAFAAALMLGASGAAAQDKVKVGSKIDSEGALLGNMIVLVLENLGVPVENRLSLGPTKIVRTALTAGEIDVYPEYTGNGAFFFQMENDPAFKAGKSAYETVKKLDREKNNLVWLDPAPANNTWAIAVRQDFATAEKLESMADFAKVAGAGKVKLAASAEFVESAAALPSFEKTYGFTMPRDNVVVLPGGDTAVTMRAAAQQVGGVNSAMVYGTDGAISALDLKVMTDTKGAQIVYEPAAVIRAPVLEKHPAIRPALSKVFTSLTLEDLQRLNAQIAVEGRQARDVAKGYLDQKGLLSKS